MFLVTIIKLSMDLLYLNLKEGFMHSPKNVLGSLSSLFFSNTNIHVCNTSTEMKIFLKKRFLLDKMFYQNASKFQKGKSKVSWIEIPKKTTWVFLYIRYSKVFCWKISLSTNLLFLIEEYILTSRSIDFVRNVWELRRLASLIKTLHHSIISKRNIKQVGITIL